MRSRGQGIVKTLMKNRTCRNTVSLAPSPYKFHGIASGILKLFNTVDSAGITKDIVDGTPRIADGYMSLPDGPGLGITLNRENLKFYLTKGKQPVVLGKTF